MQVTFDQDMAARVNEALAGAEIDALVASSFENVAYLSGTSIRTQLLIPDRLALIVWPADQSPTFIVCTIEEAQVRRESWIKNIRGYEEFVESPARVLAEVLTQLVPARARVAIEKRHLTAQYYDELRTLSPALNLVAADPLLDRIRMIKSRSEIAVLEEIAYATDQVIRSAFEGMRIGDTEKDVATRMDVDLKRHGADTIEFNHIATGANAKLAHPAPSDTRMEPGQVVRTDFGGRFGRYFSDIARTAIVRPASPKQRETYERLCEAQGRVIDSIRPGMPARDLYSNCRAEFERLGLVFSMPHIGHGLGVGLHEHPMLSPLVTEPLQPGMVLAIEPVHRAEDGIYHTEDLVEVTSDGARILSRSADWSLLLEVGKGSP